MTDYWGGASGGGSWSGNPLDVVGSPIYNILHSIAQMPGVNQTGFDSWLSQSPLTQGVQQFQAEHPGGALAADVAASFIPFVGWDLATARAGTGALGAVNAAARGAASAFPRSASLAYAAGEGVRFAPLAAGITGFDLAAGKFNSPWDALGSFAGTTIGFGALQAAGHAAVPLMSRVPLLGGAWKTVFSPGPELQRMYGFSANVQDAARRTARSPRVQEAASPLLAPQQRAAALWDLIAETKAGQHPDVDLSLLQGQYDTEIRSILHGEVDPADRAFRFPRDQRDTPDTQRAVDHLLRMAPNSTGNRVRVPITASGNGIENPDILTGRMELPAGWIHDTELPGLTQATLESAEQFRSHIGLTGEPRNWRRLTRTTPSGQEQTWALRREADNGPWLAVTEVPVQGNEIHRMTGRARYASTKGGDKAELAKVFLSFKTHNPSRFFPEMRLDTDAADPGLIGRFEDRIPRKRSEFLDKAMDFSKLYLNRDTIKAGYEALTKGRGAREAYVREMLAGPTAGRDIANFFETYTAPTDHQLSRNPEARAILGLYQALFDAAQGRAGTLLHGTAAIPAEKGPIAALFSSPDMKDADALVTQLRQAHQASPDTLEIIRKFDKQGGVGVESLAGHPAGQWLALALDRNEKEIEQINSAIKALKEVGATDARLIPERQNHFGLSRNWDGGNFHPIFAEGGIEPVAVVAGGSREHSLRKAEEWVQHFKEVDGVNYRIGKPFIAGESDEVPAYIRLAALNPGLLEPRAGLRGYEHEFQPYKHIDDLIKELEENYIRRWRYAASTIGDALTGGKLNQLKAADTNAFNIVRTRIAQLKGQPGPLEKRMNQIVDGVAAKYVGTNSFSKAADAANELNFHLLHGVGNVATPLLNMTSVLQNHLPEAVNFLTSDPAILKGVGYQFPVFGPDGLPRPGMNHVSDPIGLLAGAFKRASNPDDETREVYQALWNKKEMGTGLANEYIGQDRTMAQRVSEGVRGPEDIAYWAKRASSLLMSKTEQISRTLAAGMALESMARFEAMNGVRFTMDQKIANALKYVRRTNYGYFTADRPMMYTTPLGALFGNQKTWMTNYLFMMGQYLGLATKGNVAPLLWALGTTTALGGALAVPLMGAGMDAFSKFFAHKPATEAIYEAMGEGGNAISFGLPALFGMSLTGNVSAPGSNLAHDASFFQSIVAVERAKQIGRMFGRAWDDQMTLGMNPLGDPLFRRQAASALAPRAVYRAFEALTSDQLHSAATGYPMRTNMGWGARVLTGLGFRDVDTALQYEVYDHLLSNKAEMTRRVSLFGEAYAQASMANDRQKMMELLQQSSVLGLDISAVMRSAQRRMRDAGKDMFGRNFTSEQTDQYQSALAASGRR